MVVINGYDIELSRGDTLALRIDLSGRDLPEGSDGVMTIKKHIRSDEVVLQKRFNASDEKLDIVLSPEDTNLEPGVYCWDVRLQIPSELGGYEVYTPMEYASFVVLPVVGESIGVDGDPGLNPDLPVLQVLIDDARKVLDEANGVAASVKADAQSAAQTLSDMNNLVSVIEAKGAQTLESIPDEYAALCAQADGMSAMRPASVDGKIVWELGSLSSSDGSELNSSKRCRTIGFLPLMAGQTLYVEPNGQQYSAICYSTEGAFEKVVIAAWQTASASYTADADCMIRIVCAKTDGAEMTAQEVTVSVAVEARIVGEVNEVLAKGFFNRSELTSCDLNDIKERGYYNLVTAHTYQNTPADPNPLKNGMLLVFTVGVSTTQIYVGRTNGAGLYLRRFVSNKWTQWNIIVTSDEIAKPLSILAVGNSFNQDVMAYLPAILTELMPDVQLTVATCYTSSASLQNHVDWFESGMAYTVYNEWVAGAQSWARYSGDEALTLSDVLKRHDWDLILTQGTSSDVLTEEAVRTRIITPGRQLLRILQQHAQKPFAAMWCQWMGRQQGSYTADEMYAKITAATKMVMQSMGMQDYVPIGTAIQSARTNAVLQALGDGGNMLYSDQVHMQAGIPALIAAYTTALKVLEWYGRKYTGLYGSTFVPDADTALAISCTGLTHGEPAGITAQNIRMAQEIAAAAVRNPDVVTDCSAFV